MPQHTPTATGYLRYPALRGDTLVLVCEDDLWTAPVAGGIARRLTANLGPVGRSAISPDGAWIAFTGSEEHHTEVYVMPNGGGSARRVTWLGTNTEVRGWLPDGRIVFASDTGQPFAMRMHVYAVGVDGGQPERLPYGPAYEVSHGVDGQVVLGRHTRDPARWKRYRGGTRGDLWVDRKGEGSFRRLVKIEGNLASPMWVGDRVYFLSDHEGHGNLYSCRPTGSDVRRHTDHEDYYARWASTDGERVVYQLAASIRVHDPSEDSDREVPLEVPSPRIQRNRKFVDASRFTHGFSVHPEGHSVSLESRGKLFTMPLWERGVTQHGARDGVRYRLSHWTHDGGKLVTVSDAEDHERIEVHEPGSEEPRRLDGADIGRPLELVPSPTADVVAIANHRMELITVDLSSGEATVLDRSPYERVSGLAWSPDGRWLAYSTATTAQTRIIRLAEPDRGRVHDVTSPEFRDVRPSFDPEGRYLYFLSYRVLDPVFDTLYFDLGFPRAVRPHLVTLRADVPNPFVPEPKGFGRPPKGDEEKPKRKEGEQGPPPVEVDLDGIAERVLAFPMPEGRYTQCWGIKGKVLFLNHPITGTLQHDPLEHDAPQGRIEVYDLEELKQDTLVQGASIFKLSRDNATLVYAAGRRLRALRAGDKPDPKAEKEGPGRRSGWIDLGRVRVSVDPPSEWRQMFREAWRFQKQHFWVPDMSGVDWDGVWDRYSPLLDKVTTRLEFSDLMWEMLGELGTSHAYEIGGDVKPPPPYRVGHLGADLELRPRSGRWVVSHIVRGDTWDPDRTSPLAAPGVGVKEGDSILAVNGQPVGPDVSPQELLVNQARQQVDLTVADGRGRNRRTVVVRTLASEIPARYREWVEANRRRVHEASDGRLGYVHVPDMGPRGYAEFHRYYRAEVGREGLVVDVRFNGGGNVSQLIIEKLSRERLGYDIQRWGAPEPYPSDSPPGPLVCLTNERAGSDGDIFTHVFKLKGLGPVVGKRTWGGVIGISMRHVLVDNGVTTQPEYSFWFKDVGWGVENYGTDPDHDIDIKPQDHVAGEDPQMAKAIDLAMRALKKHRPLEADLSTRPNLRAPKLPPRPGPKKRRS